MPKLTQFEVNIVIHLRPGSHAVQLIISLSVVGELPMRSLSIFGSARSMLDLIYKASKPQTYIHYMTKETETCVLLTVSGKYRNKSIRLHSSAIPILKWFGAEKYYMKNFKMSKASSNAAHVLRNHRVAEAAVMFLRAGAEIRPYRLPYLQTEKFLELFSDGPCFYTSRELKRVPEDEMNKTMYTRIVGALFTQSSCFAVYNTRNAVMKWAGQGEIKARITLEMLSTMNAGISEVDSAILFGESEDIALQTVMNPTGIQKWDERIDRTYRYVHFIPMNEFGIRQLKILMLPDWKEKLLGALFAPETRSDNEDVFEYDARGPDGTYYFSFLDGDIARLKRFWEATCEQDIKTQILCFPAQTHSLRKYLGEQIQLKPVRLETVERALKISKEDLP